jgi:hypothetical protein
MVSLARVWTSQLVSTLQLSQCMYFYSLSLSYIYIYIYIYIYEVFNSPNIVYLQI